MKSVTAPSRRLVHSRAASSARVGLRKGVEGLVEKASSLADAAREELRSLGTDSRDRLRGRRRAATLALLGGVFLCAALVLDARASGIAQHQFNLCALQNGTLVYTDSPIRGAAACVSAATGNPQILMERLPGPYHLLLVADLEAGGGFIAGSALILWAAVGLVPHSYRRSLRLLALVPLAVMECLLSLYTGFLPPEVIAALGQTVPVVGAFVGFSSLFVIDFRVLELLALSAVLLLAGSLGRGRERAALKSALILGVALVPLPVEVYFYDNSSFGEHFAEFLAGTPLAWVTNEVLLVILVCDIAATSLALALLRRRSVKRA